MNPETLDKAASLVRELATTLGQPALDVALLAAKVAALNVLSDGLVSLVTAVLAFFVCRKFAGIIANEVRNDILEANDGVVIGGSVVTVLSGLICVAAFFSAGRLFNAAAWVSLWHPEVWLALKVLP